MPNLLRDPRARTFLELVTLSIILLLMALDDAPEWAMVLAVFVGTRASLFELAADRGNLQKTILSVDANVDRTFNLIDKLSRKS